MMSRPSRQVRAAAVTPGSNRPIRDCVVNSHPLADSVRANRRASGAALHSLACINGLLHRRTLYDRLEPAEEMRERRSFHPPSLANGTRR